MNSPLWLPNLAFWSAQVAVLVAVGTFLPSLLKIRQPRVLLAYWRTLLTTSLALPILQPWHRLPAMRIMNVPTEGSVATLAPMANPTISHWHLPSFQTIALVIGFVILAGIATRLGILILGLLKLRQFRRDSTLMASSSETTVLLEQTRSHLNVRADFRLSADVDSPVTFGLAAPIILLPESFPTMDPRFQLAIACHELLHVRRHDWAHHLVEETIRAVFWFHPAIAWLIARTRLAREQVVDHEVVRLTNARKTYLEVLLEFTPSRAVLAPPFLVERQLAERIALMLKEVRMSRTRLVASLIVMSCCVVFAITLAAWTFPLNGGPLVTQSTPKGGVAGGIAGGVSGGVEGGIGGGINGQSADQASVERNSIWTDTVKRGAMVLQVRGSGTIVRGQNAQNMIARISLPSAMTVDVRANQTATVYTPKGVVKAHVIALDGSSSDQTRRVEIALDGPLPEAFVTVGVEPVDATIDIGKLDNVLWIGRPVHTSSNAGAPLFKLVGDGTQAQRVYVKFGVASAQTIEVVDGLKVGDKVILSDMSDWENFERIHIK
jgi:beta-lactamase regulating signal transducer with metallopeptidase domain